jgi:hypothetical protein
MAHFHSAIRKIWLAPVLSLDGLSGGVSIARPFHPDATAELPAHIVIPPHPLAPVVTQ